MAFKKKEFIPQTRAHPIYRQKNGRIVPGASTVAKIAEANSSSRFLVRWANQLGLQGYDSDKYRDKLADVGTLTHGLCLEYFKDKPDYESWERDFNEWTINEARKCFEKFKRWAGVHNVEPILCEGTLVSEIYPYGGQIDLYAKVDGVRTLLDYKSGKRIYNGYWYQLAGYNTLLYEHNHEVGNISCLRIGRTESEGFQDLHRTPREIMLQWEIFRRALEIYWLQKQEVN
jgi:hypothetical protein